LAFYGLRKNLTSFKKEQKTFKFLQRDFSGYCIFEKDLSNDK